MQFVGAGSWQCGRVDGRHRSHCTNVTGLRFFVKDRRFSREFTFEHLIPGCAITFFVCGSLVFQRGWFIINRTRKKTSDNSFVFHRLSPRFSSRSNTKKQLKTYKIPELMIEQSSSNPFKTKHCSCIAKPELLFYFFFGVYNRFSHHSIDEKPSEVVSIAGSRAHQPCGWFTTNDPAENWVTGWIRSWRDEIHIW